MKEYYVQYVKTDGEEYLIVLPTFRKVLFWFLRTTRYCNHITIFTVRE